MLGVTLSGLGIAQALGVAIPLAGYLAAALLIIGLTLVAATWLGRARGLLPLGVVLAQVLSFAHYAHLPLPGWLAKGLVAWFVGGFVYLVLHMDRGPRDPWDDGARV